MLGALAVVLLGLAAVNLVVDPYRTHGWFELGLKRDAVSPVLNQRLWKLVGYAHAPTPRIVLGDSRCDRLRAEYFAAAGVPSVTNLSFGGGTLDEAIDAYEWARQRSRLDLVVLCLGFDVYNEARRADFVREAQELMERPATYALSPFVFRSSLAVLRHRLTGHAPSERPDATREAFWKRQLGPEVIGQSYRTWQRPAALWTRLESLARRCREEGTALLFVVPPNHVDLQASVDEYGLRAEYDVYKARLATLAPVADFDFPNALTRDAANYGDPYHAEPWVYERVVRWIVRGEGGDVGRWITPEGPSPASGAGPGAPARRP